jgi:hypothetical protein
MGEDNIKQAAEISKMRLLGYTIQKLESTISTSAWADTDVMGLNSEQIDDAHTKDM